MGCIPVKLKTNEKGFTAEAICSFGCAFFSKQGDNLIFERKVHHKQIRINLFYHDKDFSAICKVNRSIQIGYWVNNG